LLTDKTPIRGPGSPGFCEATKYLILSENKSGTRSEQLSADQLRLFGQEAGIGPTRRSHLQRSLRMTLTILNHRLLTPARAMITSRGGEGDVLWRT
jgi:hypothetical protein